MPLDPGPARSQKIGYTLILIALCLIAYGLLARVTTAMAVVLFCGAVAIGIYVVAKRLL